MFSCIGKLSGGHQAAVMCVTTWDGPNNTDYVATGSKDHYVKVNLRAFEEKCRGKIFFDKMPRQNCRKKTSPTNRNFFRNSC